MWVLHYVTIILSVCSLLSVTTTAESLRREAKENTHGQAKIIGGDDAEVGRYPYMASLVHTRGRFTHRCGATLIASNILLTAAHCYNVADDWIKVVMNPYSISDPLAGTVEYQILESRIHPSFSFPHQFSNDFMLLRINGVPDIAPIRLNTNNSLPVKGESLTAVGWGSIGDESIPDDGILQVDTDGTYVELDSCNATYRDELLSEDMLCVMSDRTCFGDSGGPSMYTGADASEDLQYGITSFGMSCRSSFYPGVYSRISYRWNWIRRNACEMADGNVPDYFDCPLQSYSPSEFGASAPTASPAPTDSPVFITIKIVTDAWPKEISWQLTNADGDVIDQREIGEITAPGTPLFFPVAVNNPSGLSLTVKDEEGDGICCTWGDGSITIYLGSENTGGLYALLAEAAGNYGAQITLSFDAVETPSPVTEAPTSAAPTFAPVTSFPVTAQPTLSPITPIPTLAPITPAPTLAPITPAPTDAPVTIPTDAPVTMSPVTSAPLETPGPTPEPTKKPTFAPSGIPSDAPSEGPSTEPSAFPTITTSCLDIPEGGCSICGPQQCVANPSFTLEFEGQPPVRCDLLENAARSGNIPASACEILPTLEYLRTNCECSSGTEPPSMAPSQTPSDSPSPPPTWPERPEVFTVVVNTDGYPLETSWTLQTKEARLIKRQNFGFYEIPEKPAATQVSLQMGTRYTFILYDLAGDGMCCEFGLGNLTIYYGIEVKPEALLLSLSGDFTQANYVDFIAQDPAISGPGRIVDDDLPSFFCFPGDSACQVEGRGEVLMRDLQLGDKVLVDSGKYEPLYSFGHTSADVISKFVQLTTSSSNKLELSSDHMVFMEGGRSVPAGNVKIGDRLFLADGDLTTVQHTRNVVRKGAFAPFTPSGSVVVNGVKASSFVAFQNAETLRIAGFDTGLTFQFLAHTFEGPHRTWCQYFSSCESEQYTEEGVSHWVHVPHQAGLWFLKQHPVAMAVLSVPVLVFFGIMAYPLTFLCTVLAMLAARRTRWSIRFQNSK